MEFDDGQKLDSIYAEELSESFSSDLTHSEEEEEEVSSSMSSGCFTMVELNPVVESLVVPPARCLKRRYHDEFVDNAVPERRSSRQRIHQQFALLRAVVPDFCSDEKASILTSAHEYIEKLQRLEAELRCELDTDSLCEPEEDVSCCEDDSPSSRAVDSAEASSSYYGHCSHPTVEVVRTEEGLKMHVECATRPGLLLGMMEMLESSGLTMEQANIECVDQRLVFDGIGSKVESELDGVSTEIAVSAEAVGARLRSLITDQTQGADEPD